MIDSLRRERASVSGKSKLVSKAVTPKLKKTAPKRAKSNHQKAREHIHECALKIIEHIGRYGDIRLAIRFLKELPDQHTQDAIKVWFCTFGKVSINHNDSGLGFDRNKRTRIGSATAKPYWKFLQKISHGP
jgi:hypothetical protein